MEDERPYVAVRHSKAVGSFGFNNFVYTVAEDAVRQIDEHLRIICDYRYSTVVTDHVRRYEMLPSIGVPVKYDILPDQMLTEELTACVLLKVSPVIINAAEIRVCCEEVQQRPGGEDKGEGHL